MWNCLLLIYNKQLIKSRADSAEPIKRLVSVLLPSTYFRTLWSDGLRSLLLLVVTNHPAFMARLSMTVSDFPASVSRPSDVCRICDHDRVSNLAR
jgi:hypothetical protein